MKTKKLVTFGASLAVSLFCLVVLKTSPALAAVKTWTDTSADHKFSTSSNWSPSGAPTNGDSLVFPVSTGLTSYNTFITNDIDNLSVAGISFTGNSGSSGSCTYRNFNFNNGGSSTTDPLTLTGNIDPSAVTGECTPSVNFDMNLAISTSTFTLSGHGYGKIYISFGDYSTPRTLSIGSSNLVFSASGSPMSIYSNISGTGNITSSSGGLYLGGDNSGFSGTISSINGELSYLKASGLGTGGVTVGDNATISYAGSTGEVNVATPLTITGSGNTSYSAAKFEQTGYYCDKDMTLKYTGPVTLNNDADFNASCAMTLQFTQLSKNGHNLTNKLGSSGILKINNDTVATSDYLITTLSDDKPTDYLSIGSHAKTIVTGKRGTTNVFSDGFLMGTGTVGNVTLYFGGHLAPGLSPGCLTTNNLEFKVSSFFDVELGGTTACSGYDQVTAVGTVDPGAAGINLSLYNGFKPKAGDKFTIINNDGTDKMVNDNTFAGLPEGGTIAAGGYVFTISYVGGDGNDVVLTVKTIPGAPDTGVAYFQNRPLLTLIATSVIAGAVVVLARAYNKRMQAGV